MGMVRHWMVSKCPISPSFCCTNICLPTAWKLAHSFSAALWPMAKVFCCLSKQPEALDVISENIAGSP